jgi:hypothetical protein
LTGRHDKAGIPSQWARRLRSSLPVTNHRFPLLLSQQVVREVGDVTDRACVTLPSIFEKQIEPLRKGQG